jgi:hypothetical protein
VPNKQGIVIAQLEDGYYLCQFFEALMGELSTMAIFHVSSMAGTTSAYRKNGTFEFFEDDAHLRDWSEYRGKYFWERNDQEAVWERKDQEAA